MNDLPKPKIRKACDLCYHKRIRCDSKKPRCSHCVVYDSKCTHEAASRLKKPPASRLTKSKLRQCTKTIDSNEPRPDDSISRSEINVDSRNDLPGLTFAQQLDLPLESGVHLSSPDHPSLDELLPGSSSFFSNSETLTYDPLYSMQMQLLPEVFVRQLVDTYLANVNSIFPLFDPRQLIQTVNQWYNRPTQRNRRAWAVINVVMAMAKYYNSHQVTLGERDFSVGDYLNRAQSVMTEMLMRDLALENLQVILGLVMVFHATSDVKPAVFLMSTALRLSQVLGIQRRDSDSYENATPRGVLQKRRVFWISCILDQDISMRIQQPPIYHDSEISIELPPEFPDSEVAGFVSTPGMQQTSFNLFRACVELAQIQGLVYDSLFSVRSKKLSLRERGASSQRIRRLLKDWKGRIPMPLSPKSLSGSANHPSYIPGFLCSLYGKVITCLGQLCQVNAMDFEWVDQLIRYGRSISGGLAEPFLPPPQPQGWSALINACREFMLLFTSVQIRGPSFLWTNICPYASALVCLSVNSILNFDNRDSLENLDSRLIADAIDDLCEITRQINHKTLVNVLGAVKELQSQYRFMTADEKSQGVVVI